MRADRNAMTTIDTPILENWMSSRYPILIFPYDDPYRAFLYAMVTSHAFAWVHAEQTHKVSFTPKNHTPPA